MATTVWVQRLDASLHQEAFEKPLRPERISTQETSQRSAHHGVRINDGDLIPNFFPQIITHEEWNAARESVAKRTHNYMNSKTGEVMHKSTNSPWVFCSVVQKPGCISSLGAIM
jgi:hypothetical protein